MPKRYDSLRKYLNAREGGERGWKAKYDRDACGGDYAYLSGHYTMLLDGVLDLIPPRLLHEALTVAEEIEERRHARHLEHCPAHPDIAQCICEPAPW